MGIPKSSAPVRPHLFIDEFAARRGLNEFTIYHWLSETPSQLPSAFRLGVRIVFKLKDVEAWEESVLVPYSPGQKPAVRQLGEQRAHIGRPTKAQQNEEPRSKLRGIGYQPRAVQLTSRIALQKVVEASTCTCHGSPANAASMSRTEFAGA